VGPASATSGNLASYGDNTGKLIGDASIAAANVVTAAANITSGNIVTGTGGAKAVADGSIAAANLVTAAANIADGNLAEGNAAKGLEDSGIAKANVVTAAGTLTSPQVIIGGGSKAVSALAAGTDTHVLTMVSGSPAWAAAASGSGDVVGPASATDGRVALFDGITGKLIKQSSFITEGATGVTISTNLFSANNTLRQVDIGANASDAVIIGNAASATVSIGNASGGGTSVFGTATFNGALLSPGTGADSVKVGTSASAVGGSSIAIGNLAACSSVGSFNIAIGKSAVSSSGGGSISLGASATASATDSIAIGSSASATGARAICIGQSTICAHGGGVAIGRSNAGASAATAATDDFVLGVAAHNYKMPGTIITDLRFRTATGSKIGSGPTELMGFWGATPVDQPAAVADATDATSVIARLNDLLARLREIGIIAT
jgi:hypothetical protein